MDAVKNLSGFDGLTATPGGKPAKRKRILTPEEESKKKEKEVAAAERKRKAMNGRMKHLDIAEACFAKGYENAAEINEYMDKRLEMDKEYENVEKATETQRKWLVSNAEMVAGHKIMDIQTKHAWSTYEKAAEKANMDRGALLAEYKGLTVEREEAKATIKKFDALRIANQKETDKAIKAYQAASAQILEEHASFLKSSSAKPKESQSVRVLRVEIAQLKATIGGLEKAAKKAKGRRSGHDDQRHRRKVLKEMEKQHSASPKSKKQISGTGGGSGGPSGAQ